MREKCWGESYVVCVWEEIELHVMGDTLCCIVKGEVARLLDKREARFIARIFCMRRQ